MVVPTYRMAFSTSGTDRPCGPFRNDRGRCRSDHHTPGLPRCEDAGGDDMIRTLPGPRGHRGPDAGTRSRRRQPRQRGDGHGCLFDIDDGSASSAPGPTTARSTCRSTPGDQEDCAGRRPRRAPRLAPHVPARPERQRRVRRAVLRRLACQRLRQRDDDNGDDDDATDPTTTATTMTTTPRTATTRRTRSASTMTTTTRRPTSPPWTTGSR